MVIATLEKNLGFRNGEKVLLKDAEFVSDIGCIGDGDGVGNWVRAEMRVTEPQPPSPPLTLP
jgi:hypothetical protein